MKRSPPARRSTPDSPVAPPTADERQSLPIGSLPYSWLPLSAPVARRSNALYVDGISVLLELALLGLLDAPLHARSGRGRNREFGLVVTPGARSGAALGGALERLRSLGEPLEAGSAVVRIAPYVAALEVPMIGVDALRARVERAVIGDGPTDIRTALLVWMFKEDCALGAPVFDAVFPRRAAVSRRALRRVGPDFYALADHEIAATVHRVLFAVFRVPPGGSGAVAG